MHQGQRAASTGTKPVSAAAIQRRLDAIALQQLREHAAALHAENERLRADNDNLRTELVRVEGDAYFWHDEAINLIEQMAEAGTRVGMTVDGALVVLPSPGATEMRVPS